MSPGATLLLLLNGAGSPVAPRQFPTLIVPEADEETGKVDPGRTETEDK